MGATGKVKTIFTDKERTEAIFPRTKVSAVSDDNGVGLNALLSNVLYTGAGDGEVATVPVNADTLGGRPAEDYATESFVTDKIADAQLNGGAAAQPDWSQNDETAADYVKNRTHWIETGAVEIHNGTISFSEYPYADVLSSGSTNYKYDNIKLTTHPNAGNLPSEVNITIDGIKYICPLGGYISYSSDGALSEYKVAVGDNDYLACTATYRGYNALIIICTAGLINSQFLIEVDGDRYVTLDERFIPDTIARKSDINQSGSQENSHIHTWDELEDKPVTRTGGDDTLTWDGNTEGLVSSEDWYKISNAIISIDDLSSGGTAKKINGEYTLSSTFMTAGNLQSIASNSFCSDGYFMYVHKNDAETLGMESGVYFFAKDGVYTSSLTITNYTGFNIIEKLDVEYLPVIDILHGGTNAADAVTALDNLGALNLAMITDDAHMMVSGDDLNSEKYTTPGAYRCPTATVATSLVNKPSTTNAGFRLIVSSTSTSLGLVQIAIYNTVYNRVYMRIRNDSGTWGNWEQFAIGTNKVFNKLTDIGITTFPTTMKTVADSMPANSTLMLDSRDIIAGGTNEISDLGNTRAGMYMFMRGNSNARLSLLNIYGATSATTSYLRFGCYAATNDAVTWIDAITSAGGTLTGNLTAPQLNVTATSQYPLIKLASSNADYTGKVNYAANANVGRAYVAEYAEGSSYCEYYNFPTPATNLTANKDYYVLTTKTDGITKLWENSSPTSNFAAQTVLDATKLAGYDAVIVCARVTEDTDSEVQPVFARIGAPAARLSDHVNGVLIRRLVTATANGIVFEKGGKLLSYKSATVTDDNGMLIPTIIYGVKGIR